MNKEEFFKEIKETAYKLFKGDLNETIGYFECASYCWSKIEALQKEVEDKEEIIEKKDLKIFGLEEAIKIISGQIKDLEDRHQKDMDSHHSWVKRVKELEEKLKEESLAAADYIGHIIMEKDKEIEALKKQLGLPIDNNIDF